MLHGVKALLAIALLRQQTPLKVKSSTLEELTEQLFGVRSIPRPSDKALPHVLCKLFGSLFQIADISGVYAATHCESLGQAEQTFRQDPRKQSDADLVSRRASAAEETKDLLVRDVEGVVFPVRTSQPGTQGGFIKGLKGRVGLLYAHHSFPPVILNIPRSFQ
jgi:hypothetical protein